MKKILVAGGCGFLGSHLCEKLLNLNYEVVCLDNFHTGYKSNVSELLKNKKFSILNHDICNSINIKVDGIFNLACPASPEKYQEDPIQTLKTCFLGNLNLLGVAKKLDIPILLASTSEIYGDPLEHPQDESYWGNVNTVGPRSCYDEGKRISETLFNDYKNQHKVNIKIARIFNTYGPKMSKNDGRVVSNFINQALLNKDIKIYGKTKRTRSFCFVDDMIEGLIKLFFASKKINGPINLGNPKETSIKQLAKQIIKLSASSSKIVITKPVTDDPIKRKPNIKLAKKLINWEPKVDLEKGLLNTINFFKKKN